MAAPLVAATERPGQTVEEAVAGDFVEIVDAGGGGQDPSGVWRDEVVEIGHGSIAPEERLVGAGGHVGNANNPGVVVDVVGPGAVGGTAQNAEALHEGVGIDGTAGREFPLRVGGGDQEGVNRGPGIGDRAPADDLSKIVHGGGAAMGERRRKGTEQLHFAGVVDGVRVGVAPEEGPPTILAALKPHSGAAANAACVVESVGIAGIGVGIDGGGDSDELVGAPQKAAVDAGGVGRGRGAGEYAVVVDGPRKAVWAAPGADGRHGAGRMDKAVVVGGGDVGVSGNVAVAVDGGGDAGGATGEEAEAGHGAVGPNKGLLAFLGVARPADDLAEVVEAGGGAFAAAEGAEVDGEQFWAGGGGSGGQVQGGEDTG